MYLEGRLSPAAMHDLEKAALEDPFLADALEGMEQALQDHGQQTVYTELDQLRTDLQARAVTTPERPPGRIIRFSWLRAATAAVLLLVAGLYAYYRYVDEPNASNLAANEQQAQPVIPPPVPATTLADSQASQFQGLLADSAPRNGNVSREIGSANPMQPPVSARQPNSKLHALARNRQDTIPRMTDGKLFHIDTHNMEVLPPAIQPGVVASTQNNLARQQAELQQKLRQVEAKSKAETEVISIQDSDDKLKKAAALETPEQKELLHNVIKGQVLDNFNRPLANAVVATQLTNPHLQNYLPTPQQSPNQANAGFVTDKNGFFNIPATDSILNVSVSALGFASRQVRLGQNVQFNLVQLQPDAPLGEVVVVGYGTRSKKTIGGKAAGIANRNASSPSILAQDTEPVYGWIGYEQYLEKNRKIPEGEPARSGEVVITFMVNRAGQQYNYVVQRSLSQAYDEEAMRLIKEGPKWKVLKGKRAKATVIVKF